MDSARIYARPDLPGFEHLHARFERYRYARHAHSNLVIGLVDKGIQSYTYRGERHQTGPDGIFFVNAGEAHTGEPADDEGYSYRGIHLEESFLANSGAGIRCLAFKDAVVQSPQLARLLRTALAAIENGQPALHCEELILKSVCAVAKRHACGWVNRRSPATSRQAIDRARDYIAGTSVEHLSLAVVSQIAGMSVFHFAHCFKQQVGCSPFMYAETLRIERAKTRLKEGAPIAEIAFELGYTDQSHFTRRFRQHEGVTPGRYKASFQAREASGF